ncbi:MAG: hypothetical protein IJE85_05360 [Bacteroidales bacterium]|nr:hypothetical protein [Bacteroidales bacterium]
MRQILIILCMFLVTFSVSAQEVSRTAKNDVKVSDAWVSREGRTLVIDYSIDLGENVISCDVALMMSVDGGQTFSPVIVNDKVKGDVGRITTSGQKQITYDIDSIKERLAGKKLSFKVQVKNKKKVQDNKGRFFAMGTASTFGMYGAKMGYVKKFGAYAAYSDTFSGGMFDNFTITAGGMMRATSWLYPYVGVGYGQLNFWDYGQTMYGLIPFEAGAMFKLGPIALSAAVEPILVFEKGMLATFEFGVGFCF